MDLFDNCPLDCNGSTVMSLLTSGFFEMMPSGFSIATDITCQRIIHNPVAARFYGIKAWESLSFSSSSPPPIKVYHDGRLVLPIEMPIQRSAWFGVENNGLELEFVWPDGVFKTVIYNASPLRNDNGVIIGAIGIFEEITHLITMNREFREHRHNNPKMSDDEKNKFQHELDKRVHFEQEVMNLERKVAELERLNVFGQLAAGLAHEVRNPMTTIKGFLQLMQCKKEFKNFVSQFDLMIDELDRANSIITDFLSLARIKPAKFKRQSLNDLLTILFPLLQTNALKYGKNICLELGELDNLDFDSDEITQLVLNLARNGLEAMSEDGYLTIKTFVDSEYIVLSISDEGTGIDREDISKLGNLFFTTKEKGTGLGLPMCYSIADRHRARIEVKTGSSGTTFLVRFPKPRERKLPDYGY